MRLGRGFFVWLAGSRGLIGARLAARYGHFMPARLLDSQFAHLEEPSVDEPCLQVDAAPMPAAIVDRIGELLG